MSKHSTRLNQAWDALDMGPAWLVRGPADGALAQIGDADALPDEHTNLPPESPWDELTSAPDLGTGSRADPAQQAEADWLPVESMDWHALREAVRTCTECGLSETRNNTVFGVGDEQPRWLIVGEAPGAQEDRQGEPFVGEAGQLLEAMLRSVGVSRQKGVFILNVLKCRPPGNRDPEPDEVASCSAYLHRQVTLLRPTLVFSMGRFATQALLATNKSIGSLRQQVHELAVGDSRVPLVVGYHPAYLLRRPEEKIKAWQDICLARSVCDPAVATEQISN